MNYKIENGKKQQSIWGKILTPFVKFVLCVYRTKAGLHHLELIVLTETVGQIIELCSQNG